ncbi:helix-turn-helix domain-containing protein [Streptomyces radiopugnans]|uniref:helix-turn-helix domain-containing protein n=1 Tax=Streptomyces radiopugnans TaxID=403935 RepID=UPI003F1C14A6
MGNTDIRAVRLPREETETANRALHQIRSYLEKHRDAPRTGVTVEGVEPLTLPREAVELLATTLAHLAAGRGVSIVPQNTELTTEQAADLLNVSRPFLIGLLQAGEVEYRKVGKRRRIPVSPLMDYKRRDDEHRRQTGEELTQPGQETGPLP